MRYCVVHALTRCVEGQRQLRRGLIATRSVAWPLSATPTPAINATKFLISTPLDPSGKIDTVLHVYCFKMNSFPMVGGSKQVGAMIVLASCVSWRRARHRSMRRKYQQATI